VQLLLLLLYAATTTFATAENLTNQNNTLMNPTIRENNPSLGVVHQESFILALEQYSRAMEINQNPRQIPRSTNPDGSLKRVGPKSWTSGFFAGVLWQLHDYVATAGQQDKQEQDMWKTQAIKWTQALEEIQYVANHHDVGFMLFCSYGKGLKQLATNASLHHNYKQVLLNGAKSLSTRFDPRVGCIQSWNHQKAWDGTEWFYPVIIDNMMNLELLFWASKESGNQTYRDIAIQHARTTMKHHYRPDSSSYHVVDYDSVTGAVLDKATYQGFADESSWARGQAWGLYGYTMSYRETGLEEFRTIALDIADYMISAPTMPEDGVPLWDYHVNQPGYTPDWDYNASAFPIIPRDTSAAAVTASALLELSTYSSSITDRETYRDYADKIIQSLASPKYSTKAGENNHFVLMHSVGSIPHGTEIDVPLVYADYYFLEALLRKQKLDQGMPLFNT